MSRPELEKQERQDPDAYLYREGTPTPAPGVMSDDEELRIMRSIAIESRDLLATIDLWTDCMDGSISMERIYDHVDRLEELLKELGISTEQKDEVQP